MEGSSISLFHVVVAQDSEKFNHPIGRVNLDEEDHYKIPQFIDLLDKVTEACWLSKLDLNKGHFLLLLDSYGPG